jgi:hypothetical protein
MTRDSDTACALIVWRQSVPGPCQSCGTYSQPLFFPLIRAAFDGYRLAPEPTVYCGTCLPGGAIR